jgi:hypothetical protein
MKLRSLSAVVPTVRVLVVCSFCSTSSSSTSGLS